MARPVNLTTETKRVSVVRTITNSGAAVADDSATLTDANFAEAISATLGGAIQSMGYATLWLGVEFYTGTLVSPVLAAGTLVMDLLFRDTDAPNGQRWHRRLFGDPAAAYGPTLDGSGFVEFRVDSSLVFPRVHTITGTPTTILILARGGQPYGSAPLNYANT